MPLWIYYIKAGCHWQAQNLDFPHKANKLTNIVNNLQNKLKIATFIIEGMYVLLYLRIVIETFWKILRDMTVSYQMLSKNLD